jgi:WD40 repeat protein
MTGWRIHLTNYTIEHLDILTGTPALLAVWSRRDRIAFYDLESGALIAEKTLEPPPFSQEDSPDWQIFLDTLKAPNHAALPVVSTADVTIYSAQNGYLYHWDGTILEWVIHNERKTLDAKDARTFTAVDLDPSGCLAVAVDEKGRLYLYRPEKEVTVRDFNLSRIKVIHDGEAIFGREGQDILRLDGDGRVQASLHAAYTIGHIAVSPDGHYLVLSDNDSGVIRVYDGQTLKQTHQRFAVDLLEDATQVQLIADLPPALVALSALVLDDDGVLAFGISGFLCISHLDDLDRLP